MHNEAFHAVAQILPQLLVVVASRVWVLGQGLGAVLGFEDHPQLSATLSRHQ